MIEAHNNLQVDVFYLCLRKHTCVLFEKKSNHHLCAGVPFPPSNKLTVAEVFDPRTNKPKPEVLKQHFILEGRLDEATALKIIKGGAAILKDEDTMIELEAPVTGAWTHVS